MRNFFSRKKTVKIDQQEPVGAPGDLNNPVFETVTSTTVGTSDLIVTNGVTETAITTDTNGNLTENINGVTATGILSQLNTTAIPPNLVVAHNDLGGLNFAVNSNPIFENVTANVATLSDHLKIRDTNIVAQNGNVIAGTDTGVPSMLLSQANLTGSGNISVTSTGTQTVISDSRTPTFDTVTANTINTNIVNLPGNTHLVSDGLGNLDVQVGTTAPSIINTTSNRLPGISVPSTNPIMDETYLVTIAATLDSSGTSILLAPGTTGVSPNGIVNPLYLPSAVTITPSSVPANPLPGTPFPDLLVTVPLAFPYTSGYRTTLTPLQSIPLSGTSGSLHPEVALYPYTSNNTQVSFIISGVKEDFASTRVPVPVILYVEVTTSGV